MKTVIAVKAIGRTPPGGTIRLPANQARALVAIGHAAYAPEVVPAAKRQYKRRDMVAESAAFVPVQTPKHLFPGPVLGHVTGPATAYRYKDFDDGKA